MWFDANAALSELGAGRDNDTQPSATIATSVTQVQRTPRNVAGIAGVATPPAQKREIDVFRHDVSAAGHPLTWTGRVVSLADWRKLTEWERHGPDGRMWNGIKQRCERNEGKQHDQSEQHS